MKAFLVRVGADQSSGGGQWNGPVDPRTGQFVYVSIPETKANVPGMARPFALVETALQDFGTSLPAHLVRRKMHLDPDFEHLTYGDRGAKGRQLASSLSGGDLLIFYAGLRDVASGALVYALIGLFVIDRIIAAVDWPASKADLNAHTRRILSADADDIIVVARPGVSGRLERCIPVGTYRNRAYRIREDLLSAWGNISASDGYIQRSAVFPSLLRPERFLEWWKGQEVRLVGRNNFD
jgi:Nucleotide modification associated domain 3